MSPPVVPDTITKREAQILHHLDAANGHWVTQADTRASQRTMQDLYFRGLVDGAGYDDDKGSGNYPHTRVDRITRRGQRALEFYSTAHPRWMPHTPILSIRVTSPPPTPIPSGDEKR
jgi:hypothetical protein